MIEDPDSLEPFIPFSKDSDGGFNSAFYSSDDEKGDIIIDCSYTKFFLEMGTEGTPRYIQNIISWLAAPEKHKLKDGCKDGSEYRPKKVDINIDWNDKWQGFKSRPITIVDPKKMKTLFAVDCSSSINWTKDYFKYLKELRDTYYNSNRHDKFYTWGNREPHYLNEQQMDDFISKKRGDEGTDSSLIAKIAIDTKSDNFEQLIIVTDGDVYPKDIDKCDELVTENNIQFSYVSVYIIGDDGNESVGCPFCRGCPGSTIKIYNDGSVEEGQWIKVDTKTVTVRA
jgi:hypothetical protein